MPETEVKSTFEEAMRRLEEIAGLLESGDAPLEEAMRLYEEGVRLSKDCTARLDAAKQKITRLSGETGEEVQA